jgi:hypothetical protein
LGISVAFLGLTFYFVAVYPQPRITMTGVYHWSMGCRGSQPNWWTFVFTFNLSNGGDADGFAVVRLYLNAPGVGVYRTLTPGVGVDRDLTFFVARGSQISQQWPVYAADCGTYNPGAAVISVVKA